jgi:hypothetical protein
LESPKVSCKACKSTGRSFPETPDFAHVSRYVTGLLLSPYKTLQGIYSQWVFPEGESVSRRAMHEAVFEAGWDRAGLMVQHRQAVAQRYQGQGRQVIGLDWTFAHHERSNCIYGVKRSFDYVENRMSRYQTVMTAAVSKPSDGGWVSGRGASPQV